MPRGRQTEALTLDQITRLLKFKAAAHEGAPHGYSYPQLRSAMSAGFGWETLKKALAGLPIWDLHHFYIADWIEKHLPAAPVDSDAKSSEEAATSPSVPSSSQRDGLPPSGAASEEVFSNDDERHEEAAGTDGTVLRGKKEK